MQSLRLQRPQPFKLGGVLPAELEKIRGEDKGPEEIIHAAPDLVELAGVDHKHIPGMADVVLVPDGDFHLALKDGDDLQLGMPVVGDQVRILGIRRGIDLEGECPGSVLFLFSSMCVHTKYLKIVLLNQNILQAVLPPADYNIRRRMKKHKKMLQYFIDLPKVFWYFNNMEKMRRLVLES